ncbi:MAG: hypothetical protein QF780_01005 [Candidatus Marinimicrobia bacterium]|nr:hypothetical protein [Candidatus Neomarinimicrobiota bacterium]
MRKIKELMLKHPILGAGAIFPFSLAFTIGILSIIIEIVIPLLFAVGLTYWIYNSIIGTSVRDSIHEPFNYIHTKYYSM